MSKADKLKEMIVQMNRNLQAERDANPDKETCKGCTFENERHPNFCPECGRKIAQEIARLQKLAAKAEDLWRDAKKHDLRNYFDNR